MKDAGDVVEAGGNPVDPKHRGPMKAAPKNGAGGREVAGIMSKDPSLAALSLSSALDQEEGALEGGVIRIPTGWPRFDAALGGGLERPSMTVLGAPPKSSKSTWEAISVERHVAAGGWAYVLDLENGRRRFLRRLLSRRAQCRGPRAARPGEPATFASKDDPERWQAAKAWLRRELGQRLIYESRPPRDLLARLASIREAAGTAHVLFLLDSLQRLPAFPGMDRRASIDEWIGMLESATKDFDLVSMLVSEVSRDGRSGGYKTGSAALKESSRIEYACDLILTMDRPSAHDEEDPLSTLRVELARDCDEDPRGDVASYAPVFPHYGLEELEPQPRATRKSGKTEDAVGFLKDYLAEGAKVVADVVKAGKEAGHSRATLYRARDKLKVLSCLVELKDGWRLP